MRNNPDNAPEKKEAYRLNLEALDEAALFTETKEKIWLSAYAANNPISCYHWQCDFTYTEWQRRGKVDDYGKAHAEVMKENGY